MFSSHYWLPKSTEQIINKGTDALPVLESISRSSNHAEAELAIACIKLIKSPHVEKGSRQIADKSGITLVSYTVSP